MYLILVIGATEQGKTTWIKKYLSGNKNCIVWDVQNEFGERAKHSGDLIMNLPSDNNLSRSRYTGGKRVEFLELCKRKINTICVFEDATMFFQGAIDEQMREFIFSKAHTNNNIVLVFHAINRVPPAIMEAANYIILFRTGDQIKQVANKYRTVLKPFLKLASNPKLQPIKFKVI